MQKFRGMQRRLVAHAAGKVICVLALPAIRVPSSIAEETSTNSTRFIFRGSPKPESVIFEDGSGNEIPIITTQAGTFQVDLAKDYWHRKFLARLGGIRIGENLETLNVSLRHFSFSSSVLNAAFNIALPSNYGPNVSTVEFLEKQSTDIPTIFGRYILAKQIYPKFESIGTTKSRALRVWLRNSLQLSVTLRPEVFAPDDDLINELNSAESIFANELWQPIKTTIISRLFREYTIKHFLIGFQQVSLLRSRRKIDDARSLFSQIDADYQNLSDEEKGAVSDIGRINLDADRQFFISATTAAATADGGGTSGGP